MSKKYKLDTMSANESATYLYKKYITQSYNQLDLIEELEYVIKHTKATMKKYNMSCNPKNERYYNRLHNIFFIELSFIKKENKRYVIRNNKICEY